MTTPSAPSGISGTKMELVITRPIDAGSKPRRSASLVSLYDSGDGSGRLRAHFQNELCLVSIAVFLLFIGVSLTTVATYFSVRDLYFLGPPMSLIGFVVLLVGLFHVVKKIKLRAKVAAANRREEDSKQFSSFLPQPRAPKEPLPTMPNGHAAGHHQAVTLPKHRTPNESDLYGQNNKKPPIGMDTQEVIVEDLAYVAPVGSKPEDGIPRVCFPNSTTDGSDTKDSIYTTPLARLHESPEKIFPDPILDIVPRLESRDSTKVSFASEPIVLATLPPQEQGPGVPDAASYTPISLTKVELEDYAKYGGSAVT